MSSFSILMTSSLRFSGTSSIVLRPFLMRLAYTLAIISHPYQFVDFAKSKLG